MALLVERLSRALCLSGELGCPDRKGECGTCHYAAIAVLEEMREPTPLMLKAACAAMSPEKRSTPDRVSVKAKHQIRYRAMIEAELEAAKEQDALIAEVEAKVNP